MKILITGAYGMLGSDLREVLKGHDLIATGSKDLDITDESNVMEFICKINPSIVINAAAYTAVDDCETNYDIAYAVNALGPKYLALACKELDIPLIHISTDYVFNGESTTPLLEDDELGPQSVYGETKLEGEKFIQNILDKYFILRTAWLYGVNGGNFVSTMLELAKTHDEISVVSDQVGSPTYSHDLAKAILEILESLEDSNMDDLGSLERNSNDNLDVNINDKYGIYHLTNLGECSWYEFSKTIFELKNVNVNVKPVTSDEFIRPAKRPNYSVLSNEKWINAGFSPLRDYKDALKDYLSII